MCTYTLQPPCPFSGGTFQKADEQCQVKVRIAFLALILCNTFIFASLSLLHHFGIRGLNFALHITLSRCLPPRFPEPSRNPFPLFFFNAYQQYHGVQYFAVYTLPPTNNVFVIFCRLLPPIIIYFLIVHTLHLSCYLSISRATTEPPWQHGSVSRGDVGTMMAQAGNKEGSFLVRDHSRSPGDFVLSVYQGTKPQHYVVQVSGTTAQTLLHAVLNTPFNFTCTNIYILSFPFFPSKSGRLARLRRFDD